MKIETKFNIGDKVFCRVHEFVLTAKIFRIHFIRSQGQEDGDLVLDELCTLKYQNENAWIRYNNKCGYERVPQQIETLQRLDEDLFFSCDELIQSLDLTPNNEFTVIKESDLTEDEWEKIEEYRR